MSSLRLDVELPQATWDAIAALVLLRPWTGRCEWCGTRRPDHPHHRVLRSQGGLDVPSNMAAVCAPCHRFLHDNPVEAKGRGFIVESWDDHRAVPLRLWDGRVVRLLDNYGYVVVEWPPGT